MKLLVVIGLTGEQGSSVAELFSHKPGWKVRGITRNPFSPKAQTWLSKDVEVVKADLNDPSSLSSAFSGATAIFSYTNFYEPFYSPATKSLLKEGQTINEYCFEKELQQGKNIADAAIKVEGLERFVISAECDSRKWSRGKYTWVYHFESKAKMVDYINERYPQLAGKMNIIYMGGYMLNWKEHLHFRKAEDGTIRMAIVKGPSNASRPMIDTSRDIGTLVSAAIEAAPGKKILGAGDNTSLEDQFKLWCKIHKLPYGGFDVMTVDQFDKILPIPGLGREIGEMMLFGDEFGWGGGEDVVLPQDLGVPCPLTSWEEYIKLEDWSTVISPLM
ncbi:NAD(P)-binding Rossmann-fold containing protein [Venustampulla echinocandica]|uniref:NAD(P)-binding Rossmann-fold containing protein n=1 Tax=Venustampulla echinocandica TaxID=2656787 RepID=A0A370TUY1_9HELO|nr:NAD(P)-binding Rossmann-fold containing protein [Venustampulla echinocandica]RDL39342.1 NAD(P)-binding Rossmann-fold containing protein [Venustampulla echinocandica]